MNRVLYGLLIIAAIAASLTGCATKPELITIHLTADRHINDGVRLPVDIIAVEGSGEASFMGSVMKIGPEAWFGHSKRDQLSRRDYVPLAISGGETREETLKLNEEIKRVIVYADFENNKERDTQQVIIIPEKRHEKHFIMIRESELEHSK